MFLKNRPRNSDLFGLVSSLTWHLQNRFWSLALRNFEDVSAEHARTLVFGRRRRRSRRECNSPSFGKKKKKQTTRSRRADTEDCLALFLSFRPITSDVESKLAVKGGQ